MRTCRLFLSVLVLLALVLPLQGCNAGGCGTLPTFRVGLPSVEIPPPLTLHDTQAPPQVRATHWAVLEREAAPAPAYRYTPVPAVRARAVGPCADPGPTYSPPPLPGDPNEPPESIPAFRQ